MLGPAHCRSEDHDLKYLYKRLFEALKIYNKSQDAVLIAGSTLRGKGILLEKDSEMTECAGDSKAMAVWNALSPEERKVSKFISALRLMAQGEFSVLQKSVTPITMAKSDNKTDGRSFQFGTCQ